MDPPPVKDENGNDVCRPHRYIRERNMGVKQRSEKPFEHMVDEDHETDPGRNEGGQTQK